jgi:predicted O-methyltransferase YrrM
MPSNLRFFRQAALCAVLFLLAPALAQQKPDRQSADDQVRKFLQEQEGRWHDMNISARDGQFLYDLIVKNKYTRALEIGTSTGHSAIWMAWALSKTGGKLITIEIDEERHQLALENFRKAGLAEFIDARLADAHELVRELPGPFDFVFSDADKDWYKQYFTDLAPKLTVGGCYTTHNISARHGEFRGYTRDYVEFLRSQPNFETTIENTRSSGIAVSYKRSK